MMKMLTSRGAVARSLLQRRLVAVSQGPCRALSDGEKAASQSSSSASSSSSSSSAPSSKSPHDITTFEEFFNRYNPHYAGRKRKMTRHWTTLTFAEHLRVWRTVKDNYLSTIEWTGRKPSASYNANPSSTPSASDALQGLARSGLEVASSKASEMAMPGTPLGNNLEAARELARRALDDNRTAGEKAEDAGREEEKRDRPAKEVLGIWVSDQMRLFKDCLQMFIRGYREGRDEDLNAEEGLKSMFDGIAANIRLPNMIKEARAEASKSMKSAATGTPETTTSGLSPHIAANVAALQDLAATVAATTSLGANVAAVKGLAGAVPEDVKERVAKNKDAVMEVVEDVKMNVKENSKVARATLMDVVRKKG